MGVQGTVPVAPKKELALSPLAAKRPPTPEGDESSGVPDSKAESKTELSQFEHAARLRPSATPPRTPTRAVPTRVPGRLEATTTRASRPSRRAVQAGILSSTARVRKQALFQYYVPLFRDPDIEKGWGGLGEGIREDVGKDVIPDKKLPLKLEGTLNQEREINKGGDDNMGTSGEGLLSLALLKELIGDTVEGVVATMLAQNTIEMKDFVQATVQASAANRGDTSSALNADTTSSAASESWKHVHDLLSEHRTFSRVLYILALGTPLTLLIARGVRSKDCDHPSKGMIASTGVEMGLSFLVFTACHLYVLAFHFVDTKPPRLSKCMKILVVTLLYIIAFTWIAMYTNYIPRSLFRPGFWAISASFWVLNALMSAYVGFKDAFVETCVTDNTPLPPPAP
ncbi:hypothetical protein EJB05_49121, partial [Eragrostis curvula]